MRVKGSILADNIGQSSGINFSDGTRVFTDKIELNFSHLDFYFSSDDAGNPVANLINTTKYVLVKLNNNQSFSDDTQTTVSWEATEYDYGGWWSSGSPTLITIPSGVNKIRITASLLWQARTTTVGIQVLPLINAASPQGMPRVIAAGMTASGPGANGPNINLSSSILRVNPGDTITLTARQQDSGGNALNLLTSTTTWLSVEEVR